MVSTIFQYGEDALDNEFNIQLVLPSFLVLDNIDNMLSFRATGITIPSYAPRTFTQSFRGFEIERWKPGTETARDLPVTLRLDKYWRVYDALLDWAKQIVNLENGGYFGDAYSLAEQSVVSQSFGDAVRRSANVQTTRSLKGTLIVRQENISGDVLSRGWTFTDVWPKSIEEITLDAKSAGEPLEVRVVFSYITCRRGN